MDTTDQAKINLNQRCRENMDFEQGVDTFTITFRREILFYLRQLITDGELVTVAFDDAHEAFLTVLLDIDEADDLIIFDWGGSEDANQRLLKSPKAYFVANPVGVRNQFLTHQVWKTTYKNRPAFATRIPEKFVRLQRREYFRLTLPVTQRIPCELKYGEPPTACPAAIIDIGIGGIGLESNYSGSPLTPGHIFSDVIIELGKTGRMVANLEIRHIQTLTRGVKQIARIGCRFVRLDPANEHLLQKFITKIQQEERARLG